MKVSLRLALTLLLTAVFTILVFVLQAALHLSLENRFRDYLNAHLSDLHHQIMHELEAVTDPTGALDPVRVRDLGITALKQGLLIRVYDRAGRLLWNPADFDSQLSDRIVSQLATNQQLRFPGLTGQMAEAAHPLQVDGQTVGTMTAEFHTPWNLSQTDVDFLNQMDLMIYSSAAGALVLALLGGLIFAGRLARPVTQLQTAALAFSREEFADFPLIKTSLREIHGLQTALLEMKNSLQSLQAERLGRLADTAHELRTPLANLSSQLEALADGLLEPTANRFSAMKTEILRLQQLVADWEMLEDLRAGQLRMTIGPVRVAEVARDLALLFEARLAAAGQTWQLDVADDLSLTTDRQRLQQILVNLLENAHRYSGPASTIGLSAKLETDLVVFRVSDNGPGIAPTDLPQVFDRLFRADPSRSRQSGGSGLGLTVARALAEALGGRLELSSQPGVTTVAQLSLPIGDRSGPPGSQLSLRPERNRF